MNRQHKSILVIALILVFVGMALFLPSLGMKISWSTAAENCPGDFDCDGDVDGSDLATFATDFGRTDCSTACDSRMVGEIIMWTGEMDGTGKHPMLNGVADQRWRICDGTDGTPNLIDRFVLGARTATPAVTGGSSTKVVSENNLPAHTHQAQGSTSCTKHHHQYKVRPVASHVILPGTAEVARGGTVSDPWLTTSERNVHPTSSECLVDPGSSATAGHKHTVDIVTTSTGQGEAIDIMPPYYALVFLMYIGN